MAGRRDGSHSTTLLKFAAAAATDVEWQSFHHFCRLHQRYGSRTEYNPSGAAPVVLQPFHQSGLTIFATSIRDMARGSRTSLLEFGAGAGAGAGGPPAPIMLSGSPCHRSASHHLATFSPISPLTPFCQQSSASNTVMALLGGAKTPNLDFGRPCSANLLFSWCGAFYAS